MVQVHSSSLTLGIGCLSYETNIEQCAEKYREDKQLLNLIFNSLHIIFYSQKQK
jgi:hypothetical protein